MAVSKRTVAGWVERLAEWLAEASDPRDTIPLIVAYATAAKQAGMDSDLIDRLWAAGRNDDAREAARELRAVALEARRRYLLD